MLLRCQNKKRRLNLKSKRKRNLIKKGIELSKMLDMELMVVFKCKDTGKVTVYSSGETPENLFSIDKAAKEIE